MSKCKRCEKFHMLKADYCEGCQPFVRIKELEAKVEALRASRHEAMEIYAGMEGFIPETAPEAYALKVIEQMYKALLQDKRG